jgi:CHAD domain-containing protein
MSYRLRDDETVQEGLRRSAREQLDRAIDELTGGVKEDPVTAIHDARKALKKERSLLRLGSATLARDARRRENAALRQAGRALSSARDAEVMLQAVDGLAGHFAGQVPQATFDAIRRHLEAERDPARQQMLESGLTEQVADDLKALRARIDQLPLRRGGWKALEPGLLRSYQRGAKALASARHSPTPENFHEWRKRTKDLWYHLRMLKPLSPGIVGGQAHEADELSELLGQDHDLAVLRETLARGAGGLAVDLDPVIELIEHRRAQLEAQALLIGERLYAERPKAFARRLHAYWKAWRGAARATPRPVALAQP